MKNNFTLFVGDCINELKKLEDCSVDSIVTDPPYGISIDHNKWDSFSSNFRFQKWCSLWAAECLRILKPGGHIVSFSSNRTYHRMVVGLEDAGFEIRDMVNWLYFSGMPKGTSFGRKDESLSGWATGLKPASEPIVLARKPIQEKTVLQQMQKTRTGGLNIDACRFSAKDDCWVGPKNEDFVKAWDAPVKSNFTSGGKLFVADKDQYHYRDLSSYKPTGGRWPANIFQCKKPSKREKEAGLRKLPKVKNRKNFHPSVKPIKLMRWLCRLVTPEGGLIVDPFLGSGTTAMAALMEGFSCIGCEMNEEYAKIIEHRILFIQKSIAEKKELDNNNSQ